MILHRELPEHIKSVFGYFFAHYRPDRDGQPGDAVQLTTSNIFKQLQRHCPSDLYTAEDVFRFLAGNGYEYRSSDLMEMEWRLRYVA